MTGDDPAVDARGASRGRSTPATRRSGPSSAEARRPGRRARATRPRWPAIVLRTPKGWTGPKVVDGLPVEGTFRAHQVPLDRVRDDPAAPGAARGVDAQLPPGGALRRARRAPPRAGRARAHGRPPAWARTRTPTAAACSGRSTCRTSPTTRCRCRGRPPSCTSRPASSASSCATSSRATARRAELPPLLPGRDQLEPARRRVRGREPLLGPAGDARRRSRGAGRPRDGDPERALLPGLARGLPARPGATGSSRPTRRSRWSRRR